MVVCQYSFLFWKCVWERIFSAWLCNLLYCIGCEYCFVVLLVVPQGNLVVTKLSGAVDTDFSILNNCKSAKCWKEQIMRYLQSRCVDSKHEPELTNSVSSKTSNSYVIHLALPAYIQTRRTNSHHLSNQSSKATDGIESLTDIFVNEIPSMDPSFIYRCITRILFSSVTIETNGSNSLGVLAN